MLSMGCPQVVRMATLEQIIGTFSVFYLLGFVSTLLLFARPGPGTLKSLQCAGSLGRPSCQFGAHLVPHLESFGALWMHFWSLWASFALFVAKVVLFMAYFNRICAKCLTNMVSFGT